jgi:hypothetical protein
MNIIAVYRHEIAIDALKKQLEIYSILQHIKVYLIFPLTFPLTVSLAFNLFSHVLRSCLMLVCYTVVSYSVSILYLHSCV